MLTGVVGHIKWAYYTAAAVDGYKAVRSKDAQEWRLTATIVRADDFKMAQRPLTFVAKHAKGEWHFEILSFEWRKDAYQLTARCKPPVAFGKR